MISVFIHELGHMVQYNNRNISLRGNKHNKTFYRLVERLRRNYETKVNLPKVISACEAKANGFQTRHTASKEKRAEAIVHKNSIAGKLEHTRRLIKAWETKQKRAETHLKKLRRREKIYLNRLNSTGNQGL